MERNLAKLEEVLRGRFIVGVTEPTKSLLVLTFEMVAKAMIDLGRVVRSLATSTIAVQPEEVETRRANQN